jgi:hypothetical protein
MRVAVERPARRNQASSRSRSSTRPTPGTRGKARRAARTRRHRPTGRRRQVHPAHSRAHHGALRWIGPPARVPPTSRTRHDVLWRLRTRCASARSTRNSSVASRRSPPVKGRGSRSSVCPRSASSATSLERFLTKHPPSTSGQSRTARPQGLLGATRDGDRRLIASDDASCSKSAPASWVSSGSVTRWVPASAVP